MFHLLPVRIVLTVVVALVSVAAVGGVYAGVIGKGDAIGDVLSVVRFSSVAAVVLLATSYAAWRWLAPFQRVTFPYLGGTWEGELQFEGANGAGSRKIRLDVAHTLLSIKLVLESDESTSRTVVVHAERDAGIDKNRLFYVYHNERKEGVPGAGDRYRGLAVMAVDTKGRHSLQGQYFTERSSHGTLKLTRKLAHPWWAVWK